ANAGVVGCGVRVVGYGERYGVSMGDADTVKTISRSRPHVKAVSGTQVRVKHATTMNPEDSPVFSASSLFSVGSSTFANHFSKGGRYAAYRIEGVGDEQVSLRSYELEFTASG